MDDFKVEEWAGGVGPGGEGGGVGWWRIGCCCVLMFVLLFLGGGCGDSGVVCANSLLGCC